MADRQVVIFRLLDGEYALEITSVKEIVRYQEITKIPEAPIFIKGLLNLRGQVIPVIDLKRRFYQVDSMVTEETRIVVVKVGEGLIGIIADEVSEVLRLSEKDIEPTPSLLKDFNQSGIVGVGKLEDRLLILLDIERTLSSEELKEIKKVV